MPKPTKFGTFAGVYTPSVLTILGVIMYLRLGWVVGQAGLYAAITIILVAHIISITTGLSISSIATDKKIKTGGIYYILSRSLGLPMGGSIGITLFIGTALSIALYIVGFSESFLGIQAISDFLGIQADINGIRIVGSIILVFLVIIAFISTSLAIKSQFIVLGAIGVSLISIIAGFFFGDSTAIQTNFTGPSDGNVSMITIFAIFFPAVTGFTAGVAMSGDLKDPKTSIPKGTLLSIFTGLVVYLGLAIGLAYFVDRDTLINDSSFINRIAFWSWPVIAGIWGATLSSALGGILGAPRIMQAIAKDKIMPKIFGKGYGETNEPRNALIFTFVLAELGVLMGELDAIAEVVSMFYIAAYGFINLAFALESWANTDFRPSFKISRWIGIIGFIASFGVMLQLNPAAMFAAFAIMWFIYFILKRRELKSDFGDVWSSVWSSIVRTSLNKLSDKQEREQNWSPNVLLFSGGTKNRPHLIEFGKQLVGKYGFLSNFDLVVNDSDNFYIPRHKQNIKDDDSNQNQGFFTRKQACTDIYSGIEQVASNYGFAGVEPNTVFLGWARDSENAKGYIQMIRNIQKLDMNIVMMDYDNKRGFGNHKQIDVWWRGGGQNGNFSLQLVKFILQSEEWTNAHIRLIIVNPLNEMHERIYRQAETILSNLRIDGEIKVVNNQIDKRSFYDIVQIESVNSDLIFMGIEKVSEDRVDAFVNRINELCLNIGTVVLSSASTRFREMKVGIEDRNEFGDDKADFKIELQSKIKEGSIIFPKHTAIADINKDFFHKMLEHNSHIKKKFLEPTLKIESNIIIEIKLLASKSIDLIGKALESKRPELINVKLIHIQSQFLLECNKLISTVQEHYLDNELRDIKGLIQYHIESIKSDISNSPKVIKFSYDIDDIQKKQGDIFDIRMYKRNKRLLNKLFGIKKFAYQLEYQNLLIQKYLKPSLGYFEEFLNQAGTHSIQNIADIGKFITNMDIAFQSLQKNVAQNKSADYKHVFDEHTQNLENAFENNNTELIQKLDIVTLKNIKKLNQISSTVVANALLDEEFNNKKAFNGFEQNFKEIPYLRKRNQHIQLNAIILNLNILNFSNKLKQIAHEIETKIDLEINDSLIANYNGFINYLKQFIKDFKRNSETKFEFSIDDTQRSIDQNYSERLINLSVRRMKNATQNFPQSIELFTEEADNMMGSNQYGNLETMKISATSLLDYMIQNHFNESIKTILDEIPMKSAEYQNHLIDQYRLTSYSLDELEIEHLSDQQSTEKESILKMLESQLENISLDLIEISELNKNYQLKIEERLQNSLNSIAIYPFIQAAGNLKQYIKQQKSKNDSTLVKEWYANSKNWMQNQFAQIWYRQSQGVILTQELIESEEQGVYNNQALRKLYRTLYTNPQVFEVIPFYYRQLFMRRHNFMKEMWVDRANEMQNGRLSLDDYKRGIKGGIAVIGERYSGKSFFAQMLALEYVEQSSIITLSAPAAGSVNPNEFDELLRNMIDTNDSIDEYFRILQTKIVIIIEDLELWWEKHPEGQKLINSIHDLIRKHSDKALFITTVNIHAYKVINQINNIEPNYLSVINMGAMDAKEINEMVMKRHNTSGLSLTLKKKTQANFHTWDYAKLFNRHFNFSRGIPGIAIHAWLNNVIDIQDKEISIRYPNTINTNAFEQLSTDQNWHLLLFVLHKSMSLDKFSRLTDFTKHEAFLEIERMLRKGLIYKTDDNVFRINILMHHLIVQHLQNNRLL
ncbi:MAG: amino acid permease [Bacteroidales bacterium]|nr:amino acid permease [Bacteroidales bacterium]